jgi:hypothetical protein
LGLLELPSTRSDFDLFFRTNEKTNWRRFQRLVFEKYWISYILLLLIKSFQFSHSIYCLVFTFIRDKSCCVS